MFIHIQLSLSLVFFFFQTTEFTANVASVEDGDTIEVAYEGKNVRVRLYGIDCPEDGQAFSAKAKQYTTALCTNKKVRVLKRTIDTQGRIIGDVMLNDGKSLAKELLSAGYAWHYKQYSSDIDLALLEDDARKKKKGLWVDADAMAPWEYRKAKKN
jgi:micrococcal nuclease